MLYTGLNMKKERLLSLLKVVGLPLLMVLIPIFYQKITEPKVEFQYDVSQGPAVQDDSLYKKIIVVSFYNTGSKSLNNIVGKINVLDGLIKTYSYSVTEPLKPDFVNDRNIVELNVPSMLPSDSLSLSLLIEAGKDSSKINVSLRSEEVVAFQKEKGKDAKFLSIVSLLLSFIAILLTFVSSKLSLKSGINSLKKRVSKQEERSRNLQKELDDAKELAFDLQKTFNEMKQDDFVFYLSLLIQDQQISQSIAVDKIISYPRMSDIIYQRYTANTNNDNYKKAQFCLLIVSKDAEGALIIVKNNLKKMGWDEMSSDVEEKLLNNVKKDYVSLRNEFDQIFKLGIEDYIKFISSTSPA